MLLILLMSSVLMKTRQNIMSSFHNETIKFINLINFEKSLRKYR